MRRPILFAVLAATLALPPTVAAGPRPPSEPIYFTITLQNQAGSGHEEQIEVHAVTWGTRNAPLGGWAKADGLDVTWDVPESRSTAGRATNGAYVLTAPRHTLGDADSGRVTGIATDPPDPNARGHSMLGASDKVTVGGSQTETAQATGKRQHVPFRTRMYYDTPQSNGPGTLVVKGSLPGCTVGKRYAGMQFTSGVKTYRLRNVVVASCDAASATVPTGSVTFRYDGVRG